MKKHFILTWTFLCLSSPVITTEIKENTTEKHNTKEKIKIPQNIYKKCLLKDTTACIGYKIFTATNDYFENSNENSKPKEQNISNIMRREIDNQVDNILLKKLFQYLDVPEDVWADIHKEVSPRRTVMLSMVHKKMLLPLLLGVVLKLGSLIPLVLGKLTFIGITALIASKLSLLIMGVMGLKKLFSGADGGVSHIPHMSPHAIQYQDPYVYQQAYYGDLHGQGSAQTPAVQPHKRVAYVVKGRQFGGNEFWTSPEKSGGNSADTLSENRTNDSSTFKTTPETSKGSAESSTTDILQR